MGPHEPDIFAAMQLDEELIAEIFQPCTKDITYLYLKMSPHRAFTIATMIMNEFENWQRGKLNEKGSRPPSIDSEE